MVASLLARGLRFYVVAALLWWLGPPIRSLHRATARPPFHPFRGASRRRVRRRALYAVRCWDRGWAQSCTNMLSGSTGPGRPSSPGDRFDGGGDAGGGVGVPDSWRLYSLSAVPPAAPSVLCRGADRCGAGGGGAASGQATSLGEGLQSSARSLSGAYTWPAYHAGAEWGWWPGPTDCAVDAGAVTDASMLLGRLEDFRLVRCDEAPWRLSGAVLRGMEFRDLRGARRHGVRGRAQVRAASRLEFGVPVEIVQPAVVQIVGRKHPPVAVKIEHARAGRAPVSATWSLPKACIRPS
jgi:hypothetical protein